MAEIMVRVTPKAGANERHTQPGHIVVACPDGWPWTATELNNPELRIVRLAGVTPEAVSEWQQAVNDVRQQRVAARSHQLQAGVVQQLRNLPAGVVHEMDAANLRARIVDNSARLLRAIG